MPEPVPRRPWSSGGLPSVVDLTPEPSCHQATCTLRHHPTSPSGSSRALPEILVPQIPAYRPIYHSTSRKPLRSSPLAGPALQLDAFIADTEEDKPKPSRRTSTPDLSSRPPRPSKPRRPKTAGSPRGFRPTFTDLPALEPLRRRPSYTFTPENPTHCPKSESGKESASNQISPPLRLSGSTWILRHSPSVGDSLRKEESTASLQARRPKTAHGYPAFPRTSKLTSDQDLFAFNPYEETSKCTRLNLASSSAVLPITTQEPKCSESSVKVWPDHAHKPSPESNLSCSQWDSGLGPGPARYSSSTSSFESLPSPPPRRSTVSGTTAASHIVSIAKGDDFGNDRDNGPNSHSHHPCSMPASIPKTGPLARIKRLGLRSIKSIHNLRNQPSTINPKSAMPAASANDKLSWLPNHELCASHSASLAPTVAMEDVPPLQVPASRSKRISIKRFWKSVITW